jgi:hypothetical protein
MATISLASVTYNSPAVLVNESTEPRFHEDDSDRDSPVPSQGSNTPNRDSPAPSEGSLTPERVSVILVEAALTTDESASSDSDESRRSSKSSKSDSPKEVLAVRKTPREVISEYYAQEIDPLDSIPIVIESHTASASSYPTTIKPSEMFKAFYKNLVGFLKNKKHYEKPEETLESCCFCIPYTSVSSYDKKMIETLKQAESMLGMIDDVAVQLTDRNVSDIEKRHRVQTIHDLAAKAIQSDIWDRDPVGLGKKYKGNVRFSGSIGVCKENVATLRAELARTGAQIRLEQPKIDAAKKKERAQREKIEADLIKEFQKKEKQKAKAKQPTSSAV